MEIQQFDKAKDFLEKTEEFLLKNEAINNLPLGILYRLASEKENNPDHPSPFFATAESENHPVLAMVITPPKNLIISGAEDGLESSGAIQTAVSFLKESGIQIPGVIGERNLAEKFARIWTEQDEGGFTVQMEQRIYRLDKVNPVDKKPGQLRMAKMADLALVSDWIYAFSVDANEPMGREEADELAQKKIQQESIFLWEDQRVVSMAGKSRPTKNGATVSLVYTPPAYRQKGYASSCVAALSQRILNEGYRFCSLYTDLANPTSNSIYMKMGYQPVADSIVYNFG
ncbi:MAG TPA: GNAT family N-acetyltransferase [Bacillales bacterium]